MESREQIDHLLRDHRIWRAGRPVSGVGTIVPTGWRQLDQALGGGWPLGQLTELLIDGHGIGELRLLLPALITLMGRQAEPVRAPPWVALVAPPYIPYAPALAGCGLDLGRLLVIHSNQDTDTLWAIEQVLHSQTCAAVVGWIGAVSATTLRRLQLAAESSGSWTVLLRPSKLGLARSPAPLRICVAKERCDNRVALNIRKRRGGPPTAVSVDFGG